MLYSIGHSTLNQQDFIQLCSVLDVLIDVRSHPTSRHEQHRKENLERYLPNAGIKYEWESDLGGWTQEHLRFQHQFSTKGVDIQTYASGKFPKQRIARGRGSTELFGGRPEWTNQGLYDYSWFMTLPKFISAANRLIERGKDANIGIMCCEVLWWCCHRSMIADYVVFRGSDIIHLQPKEVTHSTVLGNRLERYDPEIIKTWDNYD